MNFTPTLRDGFMGIFVVLDHSPSVGEGLQRWFCMNLKNIMKVSRCGKQQE